MQVKIIANNVVSEYLPSPVIGDIREIRDDVAQHLIAVGAVMALKIEGGIKKKSDEKATEPSSSSEPDRVSPEPTARRSKPAKSK